MRSALSSLFRTAPMAALAFVSTAAFATDFHVAPDGHDAHPKDTSGTQTLTNTFEFDWNLYSNPTMKREEVKWAGDTWAECQERGKDRHSQYADPLFVNPEQGDFTLSPGSPAWALGFQPIDLSQVGPRIKTSPTP